VGDVWVSLDLLLKQNEHLSSKFEFMLDAYTRHGDSILALYKCSEKQWWEAMVDVPFPAESVCMS